MANTSSAMKALRQTKKRTGENLVVKNAYKKAVKAVKVGIETKKDVSEELKHAQKKLDKAVKKGVLKKNNAGRKLSRLAKKVNAVAK